MSNFLPTQQYPFFSDNEEKELQLFDLLDIEDSKIAEYSHRTGQPQPFVILQECLAKSAPLANCQILTETQKAGHSKIEYRLKVGEKHEVIVTAISGNEGKQLAAQKMLKKISPQFTKYGSILRLYGSQVKQAMKDLKKEQKEFQSNNSAVKTSSTSKSSKRVDKNPEFVNAVREHMIKYAARAKPRNFGLIYSTTPLLSDEIEDIRLKSQQYSVQFGDKLLEKIPNTPKIQSIAFDLGEDISMINHSTMKNMIKLENLKNLQRSEFSQITEIFDVADLYSFITEFENTHIWFAFASNISQEYKEQLDSLIDEIIKVKLPNCYITYDDQDVAKLEIMEGRYNGSEDDMEEDEEFENSDDDEDMEEDHDEDVDMADID